ncbi:glycosyltransferase family protein [Adhaeribacter aquaticus]|uniref:glycosyltransferase family protein n=1 Tax=Adhaeribacter aquaticus TaxID=299567 RepID=UPI0004107884|nr:glycosyltransferase family protein [Adhaeribacter aquaticus]
MKILYAVQGTGNGHLSRALDVIPQLKKKAAVDVLMSGCQADLALPFPVKYKYHGMSFIFGKKGGVDFVQTFAQLQSRSFFQEVRDLPVEDYDLVINDFEPVSAWACYFKKLPCISLSHQSAVLAPEAPQPKKQDVFGRFILRNYAPVTDHFGFHFQRFNSKIFTPVIRSQVRDLQIENRGHYTVYLPAYDDKSLVTALQDFKQVQWQVFSKHNRQPFQYKNISIRPIQNEAFIESMATSSGVLCGAGFETPAEALFMEKKLLVVPMKNQYEQHCNAAALAAMGVPVIKSLKAKHGPLIGEWLQQDKVIPVHYPDETEKVVDMLLEKYSVKAESLVF